MKTQNVKNVILCNYYFKYEINADGEYRYDWIYWAKNEAQARQRLWVLGLPNGFVTNVELIKQEISTDVYDDLSLI